MRGDVFEKITKSFTDEWILPFGPKFGAPALLLPCFDAIKRFVTFKTRVQSTITDSQLSLKAPRINAVRFLASALNNSFIHPEARTHGPLSLIHTQRLCAFAAMRDTADTSLRDTAL